MKCFMRNPLKLNTKATFRYGSFTCSLCVRVSRYSMILRCFFFFFPALSVINTQGKMPSELANQVLPCWATSANRIARLGRKSCVTPSTRKTEGTNRPFSDLKPPRNKKVLGGVTPRWADPRPPPRDRTLKQRPWWGRVPVKRASRRRSPS